MSAAIDPQPGERFRRVRPRCEDPDLAALALERGGDPCPHQRRLAATRRADHREHPGPGQPPQTGLDIVLTSEVRVGVADVVGDQATVRARRAGLGKGDGGRQRRILAQDRLLQARRDRGPAPIRARRPEHGEPGASCAGRRPGVPPGTGRGPAAPTAARAAAPRRRGPRPRPGRRGGDRPAGRRRCEPPRRRGEVPPTGRPRCGRPPSSSSALNGRPRHNANASPLTYAARSCSPRTSSS